jgi:hypothetical protein
MYLNPQLMRKQIKGARMKRLCEMIVVVTALAVFSACGTSKTAAAASDVQAAASAAKISVQAEKTADEFRIVDWKDRSIGEIATPAWLLPAVRGNWTIFKAEWPQRADRVLKIGVARSTTLNGAQTIADVQYAARLAYQLKQAVLTRAGISLGSDGEFDVVNNAATQAQVNVAGQERLTDFWQLIETADAEGRKTRAYNYYVVYACDSAIWDQVAAKYIYDIVGQLPDKKTQQTISGMFNEINAEIKYEREKTDAQFKVELEARQRALQAPPPSAAETRAAYQSGDPAKIAAAGTTKADTDYVTALAALSAAH